MSPSLRVGGGLAAAGRWLGAGVLLWVATHAKDPYLLAIRSIETPLVVGVAGLGLVFLCRRSSGVGQRQAAALAAALALAIISMLASEAAFRWQRATVLAGGEDLRAVGRHFIVGYTRFDEVAALAERGLIGGVYLGRRNVAGRSLAEIRREVDALQALRAQAGLPPLFIAADQEGGSVAHMSPPLAAMPALASLVGGSSDSDGMLEARARAYGETQGSGLAALGINLNFGPVVDLLPTTRGPAFDTHTLIRRRAIAADADVVSRVAMAYGDGLRTHGVMPTLKHFPGLARADADTHHFPARLAVPIKVLADADWRPFRAAGRGGEGDTAIMLGHVLLPEIDGERPASLSPAVVRLLRREWGFAGLLITDDLNMGAVYRRGIGTASAEALAAGVDLVLISYDPDQIYRALDFAAAQRKRRRGWSAARRRR